MQFVDCEIDYFRFQIKYNFIMKKYFFIAALFYVGNSYAQRPTNAVKLVQYVFDSFQPGTIKMKSGDTYKQSLNYNIITNEMIFDNNGKYAAIAGLD